LRASETAFLSVKTRRKS